MKIAKLTVVALFAAILMGCSGEKLTFGNEQGGATNNKGYLSLAELTVDCRIDESDPEVGVLSTRATRTSVDANNFDCSIINEKNEVVKSFKFSERPTEAIELATGDYIFKMVSDEVPGAAWECPVYGATKPFKIVRNETTTLPEIVCSLMQIKVSVSYSTDLLERLGTQTLTTVSVGDNSLEYALTESRAGFFLAPSVNNTIHLRISGTYAADKDLENGKIIEMNKEVRDVKMGQHSKIHFYIEHAAEGNIKVGVTIRDWVTDEIVPCNVADLVKEEEWKDSNTGNEGGNEGVITQKDPSIEWIGYDLSEQVTIDDSTTGEIMVRASKGVKELIVQIESEVLIPSLLGSIGLADVLNITYPERSYDTSNPDRVIDGESLKSALSNDFGFPVCDEIINKTEVLFSITSFMGALNAAAGNHNFHFTIIDNEDNSLTETLKLKSTGNRR